MSRLRSTGQLVEGARGAGDDRLLVERTGDTDWSFFVADGAGGSGAGDAAAELAVSVVRESLRQLAMGTPRELAELLGSIDQRISESGSGGETTGLLILVRGDELWGASVGDSEAWLVTHETCGRLTAGQRRNPLLGDGSAVPAGFGPLPFVGRLVAGSDGLFKYCPADRLVELVRAGSSPEATVKALRDGAALPGGGLQDDIAVVACW